MDKIKISGPTAIIIVILILVLLFVVAGCRLTCNNKPDVEGYERSCLAGDCYGLQRTPVDFAFKHPNGWQQNPHYITDPSNEHQPLDYGPIDFHKDTRRLNANDGVLFQQYRNDWKGCGKGLVSLRNDEKNRFDLTNVGDQGMRNILDNQYTPAFGEKLCKYNERTFDKPNPHYDKIYGGHEYLVHDKLGD